MLRSHLIDLANMIAASTGRDPQRNAEIAQTTGWRLAQAGLWVPPERLSRFDPWHVNGAFYTLPDFVGDFEGAMLTVPDGWWLQHLGQVANPEGWTVRVETHSISIPQATRPMYARTAARAICAAGLTGRAYLEDRHGG